MTRFDECKNLRPRPLSPVGTAASPCYNATVKLEVTYPWPGDTAAARRLQEELAALVSARPGLPATVHRVAGIDISPPDADGWVRGAVVVLRWPGMEVEEVSIGRARPLVPYVPGLLGFREAPAAADALERLSAVPDAILVDGQGYAHPRRFGLACHIGLMTGLPTVGCAKSVLLGKHGPLGSERGDWTPMVDRGETVGAAVRTRRNVSPVYVSVGHRVDLESAIALVLGCCGRYRLPEPTRMAHHAAAGTLGEPDAATASS